MDGQFVPRISYGMPVIESIRRVTKLPFDVHLMVNNPDTMLSWFSNAGADIITVHAEVCPHLDKTLQTIRNLGVKAGVSLNPATNEDVLKYVMDKVDQILVMTVNPGFGGQNFIENQLEKITRIKQMIAGRDIKIEVDGGINAMTGAEAVAAGADILVAGTAVFSGGDYAKNINALR